MKGLVFSVKKPNLNFEKQNVKYVGKRYGSLIFIVVTIVLGLVIGSFTAKSADSDLIKSFDFLFVTNVDSRLGDNFLGNFSSSFVSNFLFYITVFLLGFFPFAKFIIPFVTFFKGFGAGVSASFIYISYGLKGLLFYLFVLLPGLFLYLLSLLLISEEAFDMSGFMFKKLFLSKSSVNIDIKQYVRHGVILLFLCCFSSIVDGLLWGTVGGLFNFK